VYPSMTARVTGSASDSLGATPTRGRQGASCSSSSILTYSAVAGVSKSASTRPPTRSTLASNVDHGHPPRLTHSLEITHLGRKWPGRTLSPTDHPDQTG
jgi:hypothetical protein